MATSTIILTTTGIAGAEGDRDHYVAHNNHGFYHGPGWLWTTAALIMADRAPRTAAWATVGKRAFWWREGLMAAKASMAVGWGFMGGGGGFHGGGGGGHH